MNHIDCSWIRSETLALAEELYDEAPSVAVSDDSTGRGFSEMRAQDGERTIDEFPAELDPGPMRHLTVDVYDVRPVGVVELERMVNEVPRDAGFFPSLLSPTICGAASERGHASIGDDE